MKIIYLHQYFNTPDMPGGTRSYEMARRLVGAGHEVHMITSERAGLLPSNVKWHTSTEAGIHVHWTPVPYGNKLDYRQRIKAFFDFAWRSARKAASLGGDIVFATSTPLTIAIPAVYAVKRNKIPMVFEVRDLWPELPIAMGALKSPLTIKLARSLERFAYRNSARIVALSPGMKEGIVGAGYPAELVSIIPNSCDMDLFDVGAEPGQGLRLQYKWLQERPLVVYIGTLGLINGVDYLARLAAAALNLNPEIRFVVIGTGKDEEKISRVAKELGVLNRNFFMMQRIPKKDVPGWLSAAGLATSFVIDKKELWANSANKFFDALASGTPVAINYGGWQADILRETGAGLVLDVNDVEKSAKTIVEALSDKKWMVEAGNAARALARRRFSRDKLAEELEKVLVNAANNPRCNIGTEYERGKGRQIYPF